MPVVTAAIIGAVGSAVGGGLSMMGAAKNAKARKKAAWEAAARMQAFTDQAVKDVQANEVKKQTFFSDLDKVLQDFGSGAFGKGTETMGNLRDAQEQFSRLAAGDYRDFQSQVRVALNDALAGSFGGPIGSFANTAAQNMMAFRSTGLSAAESLTGMFDTESRNLAGMQFGIWDQSLNNQIELKRNNVEAINAYMTEASKYAGVNLMAAGNMVSQTAQGIGSIFSAIDSRNQSQMRADSLQQYLGAMQQSADTSSRMNVGYSPSPMAFSTPYGIGYNDPTNAAPIFTPPANVDRFQPAVNRWDQFYNYNLSYPYGSNASSGNSASGALLPPLDWTP